MRPLRFATFFSVLILLLTAAGFSNAQEASDQPAGKHAKYKFIDLGTLGGPASYYSQVGEGNQILNNSGVIAFSADTSIPDPNAPDFCFDFHPDGCFVAHAVRWKGGILTDLGALPAGNSSTTGAINSRGWSAGFSENGLFDPLTGSPEVRAVFWNGGGIHEIGTLGGVWSLATGITNDGVVVGMATIDDIPDPFAFGPFPSATHPFIWKDGKMIDLGTLGGPDAFVWAGCGNQGLVVGSSYTSSLPDPNTGVPPIHPFVWEKGKMVDLGTLGGNFGSAQCGNDRGQVIGQSSLAGDVAFHPFLWDKGVLRDLGTLGGDNGNPISINDAGDVVGDADLPGNLEHHAFLWSKGVMTDLGTLGDASFGAAINSRTQVVGTFFMSARTEPPRFHPFIWEKNGPMVDLNTLIPANSGLELVTADNINERGEIVGVGVPARCFPDFCGHLFLLIPCASDDTEGCQDNGNSPNAAVQSDPEPIVVRSTSTQARPTPKERVASWRAEMASRHHIASRRTSTE